MAAASFLDAEEKVTAFLNTFTSSPASRKRPEKRPSRFTVVQRTGGHALDRFRDAPIITVTCTASTVGQASSDANTARAALLYDYASMPYVIAVREVSGAYYDPDPDTNEDRYTFAVQLTITPLFNT